MALLDNAWYVNFGNGSSTGYYAVTKWVTLGGPYTAGTMLRQATVSPALTERVFVCYNSTAGTGVSGASEPTWGTPTRGQLFTDGSVKWQEATGVAALNGDYSANTPNWTQYRTFTATATLGQVIQNVAGTLLLICTVGGTMSALGSEPSWSAYTTTGATTVDNGATWVTLGANNKYSIWNAPHARLANAYASTWGQAGNSFFISTASKETQSTALTALAPGSATSISSTYCVLNAPATTPPGSADISTGATLTTTGTTNLTLNSVGGYFNGLTLSAGTGAGAVNLLVSNNSSAQLMRLDNCALVNAATGAGGLIVLSTTGGASLTWLYNTTFQFGATGQTIDYDSSFIRWESTASAIAGSTFPTTLFKPNGALGTFICTGIDLSAITGTLVAGTAAAMEIIFRDCKFGSGVTVAATPAGQGGPFVDVIRSDSTGTNYQQQRYWYQGTLIPETTIVRTGGAQVTGTGVSWNITTTANSKWVFPFESFLASIQNSTTGSNVTLTMYGIWKTAAVPNNDQIWIEVDYLGASTSPLGTFINNTKASNLATGTGLTADSTSAWGAGAAAYQTSHAYGAFIGVILAGNASPQQLWFMSSHSGSGTSGASSTIFNGQADGAQVTDNAGANQIVWQAMTRWSMAVTMSSPQPAQAGQINVKVKAALPSTTFYVDPQPVHS